MVSKHFETIKNQDDPLKFIIARFLMRTNLCRFFKIKQNSYMLRFYPSALSRQLWINPNYTHTATKFFQDYLQKNDCMIDVGASIGTTTLASASCVSDKGKIYSIEPNPRIFKYLHGNIKLNNFKNIETFNVALGNKDDTIYFSDERSDDVNSINNSNVGIKVPIKSLDSLPINQSPISLLKIDAIGYEKFVLLGGQKTLEKTKCIHIAIIEKQLHQYGYKLNDIFDLLLDNNFKLFEFSNEKLIFPVTESYTTHNATILAIQDIDDFLNRTKYKIGEK